MWAVFCFAQTMAAPVGFDSLEGLERTNFLPKKGVWNDPKNWSLKKVPEGFSRAYIRAGNTCTIACPVKLSDSIIVGNAAGKEGVLYIEEGAQAHIQVLSVPHMTITGSSGVVYMRGGELALSLMKGDGISVLTVGSSGTTSGTGVFEISGGKMKGGIIVGSSLPQTNVGTLSIVGSAPVVSQADDAARAPLMLFSSGTLRFVLDKKGVAPMNFDAVVFAGKGGKIIVDGGAYAGSSSEIVLIKAKGFSNKPPVECVNFSGYRASTVYDTKSKPNRLILKVEKSK